MAPKGTTAWTLVAAVCCVCCAGRLCMAGPLPVDFAQIGQSENYNAEGFPLSSLYSPIGYGETDEDQAAVFENNTSEGGPKELYVIKAVVYEIGILADVPENETLTDDEPITQQQVDLSFFSHGNNESHINIGDIPVPIQTNIKGQVFTGIAPVHIGSVPSNLSDLLSALPISGSVVSILQTNSSYVEVHRHNVSDAAVLLNQRDLASIPFSDSASVPLVPPSVDQTLIELATNNNSPKAEEV